MNIGSGGVASVAANGNIVSSLTTWDATEGEGTAQKAVTSNSLGGELAIPTTTSWAVNMSSHAFEPPILPGQRYLFTGYKGSRGDAAKTGEILTGDIECVSAAITIDWATAAPLLWTMAANGGGRFTRSLGAQIDVSPPQMHSPLRSVITARKGNGDVIDTANWRLQNAAINFQCAISSGEADSSSDGYVDYLGGTGFGGTVALSFKTDSITDTGLAKDDYISLDFLFSGGKTAHISWLLVTSWGQSTHDNNSADPTIIPCTCDFSAYDWTGNSYGSVIWGSKQLFPGPAFIT